MTYNKKTARKHLRNKEFSDALEYINLAIQEDENDGGAYLLRYLARHELTTTAEFLQTPEIKDDPDYIMAFSTADTEKTAKEFLLGSMSNEGIYKLAKEAYEHKDYVKALQWYSEIHPLYDSGEKISDIMERINEGRKDARKNFSPSDYLHKRLKEMCPEKYKKYATLEAKAHTPEYTEGVFFFICTVLMVICSVAMIFDSNVNNSAIYVIWGIALSVVVHKHFDWEFGIIKSVGATFLMCAAPLFLNMLCDELLHFSELSFIITALTSAIIFFMTLRRDIRYHNGKKYQKQLDEFSKTAFEEEIKTVKKEIIDKYSNQWGYDLAKEKADKVKL